MEYVVNQTKQIAVTADDPEEAIARAVKGEGKIIAMNVGANPRPQMSRPAQAVMPQPPQPK